MRMIIQCLGLNKASSTLPYLIIIFQVSVMANTKANELRELTITLHDVVTDSLCLS